MIKSIFQQPGFWRIGALALVAVLVGCAPNTPPFEPKILTLNYVEAQYGDPAAFIASLRSGQTTVADELPASPCIFTDSFAGPTPPNTPPKFIINGNPGQTGFNIVIESDTPINISTSSPGTCPSISDIKIYIGASNEALDVGGQTNRTSAELVVGGNLYETYSGFFEGSLIGFRQQTGYAVGEFQFVGKSTGTAANVLLLVSGAFAED